MDVWAPSCWFELLSVVLSVMLWFWPQPSSPWLSVSRLSGLGPTWHKIQTKISLKVQIVSLWARDCCSKLGMGYGERVRDGAQTSNHLTAETDNTDSVKWKCYKKLSKNVLIRSCEMVFMAENLITFHLTFSCTAQHEPGSRALLYAYKWGLTSNVQTSDIKDPIWYTTHNIAQAMQCPYLHSSHQQCVSHVIYLDLRSFKTHFFSRQRSGCAINLTLIWGLLWSIRLNIRE